MATDVTPQPPETAGEARPKLYRLSVRQYLAMIDAGVFPEGSRVELLGGLLVEQMTKNDPHDYTTDSLGRILDRLPVDGWIVRQEKSVVLGRHWRPEPDLAVVQSPARRYQAKAPRAADIAMLIEVADSSYALDHGVKWRRYAAAGVRSYWIVHLARRRIEAYSDPTGRGQSAKYATTVIFEGDATIPVVIQGREVGRIAVGDILP